VRIHIPVITNPDVIFYCGEEQINMKAGESWIFNAWCRHRVFNGGDKDRVHLVIDTSGSSRFWDTVSKMADLDRDVDQTLINQLLTKVPYRENEGAVIRTERFNIAPIMSPGEIDALVRELIEDFERADENDRDRIAQYKSLLTDFAKDWRQLWLLYGYQKDGWPEYKVLIDRAIKRMHPDRNALITSTNKVGVNPIIMQRIFWPALSVDHYDQFIGGEDSKS
jgi:hypothetical protein